MSFENKTYKGLFIFSILFVYFTYFSNGGNYWLGHWQNKWATLLAVLSIWYAFFLARSFSWSLFFPVLLPLLSSVYVGTFYPSIYSKLPLQKYQDHVNVAISSGFYFILGVSFFKTLPLIFKLPIKKAFGLICILESIEIIGSAIAGVEAYNRGGVLGNVSMAGSLVACSYPFLIHHKFLEFKSRQLSQFLFMLKILLPVIAVFLTGATQPILIMALVVASLIFWRGMHSSLRPNKRHMMLAITLTTVLPLLAGYFMYDADNANFFSTNGRAALISQGWSFFSGYVNPLFGVGMNQTMLLLPQLNVINSTYTIYTDTLDLSMWFHSDFFQCLFEFGWPGLVSFMALYLHTLYLGYKHDKELFSCAVGYGVMLTFNYPVHLPLTALLGFFLVWATQPRYKHP